jgi:hypothetical protein
VGIDPLSSATRTAKRNLLVAATVAITYSAFDVSISKIPVGGLAIEFDNRVFSFLLVVVLIYFTATFALYYFIDIRNIEATKHQSDTEIRYRQDREDFWNSHAAAVMTKIGKSLPKGVGYNRNATQQLGNFFQEMQQPFYEAHSIDSLGTIRGLNFLQERFPILCLISGCLSRRWSSRMPRTGWTPRIVPYGADQTVYLVIDRFGGLGTVYRETEVERTDLETIIADLMSGQFNDPVRIVAFNTLEHWSEDVSEYLAFEIQTRCDIDGIGIPEHIQDFVTSYTGPTRQLALRLV